MRVLQINTSINTGSTGRIVSEIGDLLISLGHESIVAFGRSNNGGSSLALSIGNKKDFFFHVLNTRLFDRHGFCCERTTKRFVNYVRSFDPDIVHLHNIHGYYINVKVLFRYLIEAGKPVIWTFHDCWPFTGHCSHFQFVDCFKWQTGCFKCPNINGYPKSWFVDNSRENFKQKKILFTGLKRMVIVSPSEWLANHLRNSFLSDYEIKVINNGVDFDKFSPGNNEKVRNKYNLNKKYILGVANVWNNKKGLGDFIKLREIIDPEIEIILVGLNLNQIKSLPFGIKGISRTEDIKELTALYSGAEIFVNPTYVDNFPTVNIESLACGTPVVTYDTGGCSESLDDRTGISVEKGNLIGLADSIGTILQRGKREYTDECYLRAKKLYDKEMRYAEYISLYQDLSHQF